VAAIWRKLAKRGMQLAQAESGGEARQTHQKRLGGGAWRSARRRRSRAENRQLRQLALNGGSAAET